MSKFSVLIADKIYKTCMLGGVGGGVIGSAIGASSFIDEEQNSDYKNSSKTLLDKCVFGTLGGVVGLVGGFTMGFVGTLTAPITIPVILTHTIKENNATLKSKEDVWEK